MYWIVHTLWLRLVEIVSEEARRSLMYMPPSWPSGPSLRPPRIYNGLMQAVPNTKGTAVFIESTANGVTGVFYDLWKGAVEGTNGYVPVFIPWYVDPEYREPVPANFEPTPDEEDLIEKYDLDHEQLMFRRRKVAQNGLDLAAEPENTQQNQNRRF